MLPGSAILSARCTFRPAASATGVTMCLRSWSALFRCGESFAPMGEITKHVFVMSSGILPPQSRLQSIRRARLLYGKLALSQLGEGHYDDAVGQAQSLH